VRGNDTGIARPVQSTVQVTGAMNVQQQILHLAIVATRSDIRMCADGSWDACQVPHIDEPIAYRDGLKVIGSTAQGLTVTPGLVDLLRAMVQRMNQGSSGLSELQPCPNDGCAPL
jgi:hypothetical protein